MSAAAKKLSAATLLARHAVAGAGAVLTLVLAGCSSRPPAPDWALNAESASQRASTAYLEGRQRVQAMEWDKARAEVAATGRTDLAARLELMRCAAQVASLEWDDCPGYQALALDAAPAEAAYARYLQGKLRPEDVALLPELQRPVAQALLGGSASALAAVSAIKEPLPQLVAAGAALRSGAAEPGLLMLGADIASAQGWRRAVMAWLLLQARAHEQAGEVDKAQAVRRRLSLLEKTASGGGTSAGK